MENSEARKKRLNELRIGLYYQEYPQNSIGEAIRKATSIPTKNLTASKAKTNNNNLAFFTSFNPNKKNVFPLIQTAFKSLQQLYETKKFFKNNKLIKN